MNPTEYFKDLSQELRAVQNRIRNLIGPAHWPSDGAWKESVLRTVLRRYLPPTFTVGSGFILTPEGVSSQIDILVCDDSAPVLFRDGDFMITTADCVRAVVEVKTSLNRSQLKGALSKMNRISGLMRRHCVSPNPFLGLFSFEECSSQPEDILAELQTENPNDYVIRALSFGDSQFYRFWELNPSGVSRQPYMRWHAYDVPSSAPGYFVHNLVEYIFPLSIDKSSNIWYPDSGKEPRIVGSLSRRGEMGNEQE
jgi:hypothetical protein